jgi:hypothetical protein
MKPLYLFVFLGEAFRLGGQHTRCVGTRESFDMQIKASKSHMKFIQRMNINFDIILHSYTTRYDDDLIDIYAQNGNLISATFHDSPIGLNNLWREAIADINVEDYYSITYIRIDLLLLDTFSAVYNQNWDKIMFPSITFIPHHKCNDDPRVSDVMLFIPKKYYAIINEVQICHEAWHILAKHLHYNDMDTMLPTFHDSDTAKDYNPIYVIVNRPRSEVWHSAGKIFNKSTWPIIE